MSFSKEIQSPCGVMHERAACGVIEHAVLATEKGMLFVASCEIAC